MKERIYICHTFYHVYIACLKELALPKERQGNAALILSTMSNDFLDLPERAGKCPLFEDVFLFDEKEDAFFAQLQKYHKDRGNLFLNMIARVIYTRMFGKLEAAFVPTDLRAYKDIYVFCDSDPIGYYLNYKKIPYHAVEDGLDCIRYYDTARYDNRGHFDLKAKLSRMGLIFIQNGYGKYCIDMEVNNISVLQYPCERYVECPRKELTARLTEDDKKLLTELFLSNYSELMDTLERARLEGRKGTVLVLTEPLCDLETRERIFRDIIRDYTTIDGEQATVLMKPHPRDVLNYKELFTDAVVLDGGFPMEILNALPGVRFDRVVTVFTVPDAITCAAEKVFLGEDFMDIYEAPEIHRQNEAI